MNGILTNSISKKSLIVTIVILILFIGNIVFATWCFTSIKQVSALQKQLKVQQTNRQTVEFLNLFIDKVLNAQGDVSFEDRLALENQVRALNDKDILAQWEKFTSSTSEAQVQTEVKNLLSLLGKKICE